MSNSRFASTTNLGKSQKKMKKKYLTPAVVVAELNYQCILCASKGGSAPVGGTTDNFGASESRSNLWGED